MLKFVGIVSAIMLLNLTYGLEVNLTHQYYDVAPKHSGEIRAAMMAASPLGEANHSHHTIGSYEASVTVGRMSIIYNNGQCQVPVFDVQLNGTMTLPRLKMGNYPLKIRQAFEDELLLLENHEYMHAKIWQAAVQDFERKIRHTVMKDNQACDHLINEINQEMDKVLSDVLSQNLALDCRSYGDQLGFSECH